MFSELIGNELELTQCRLNGGGDCRFQSTVQAAASSEQVEQGSRSE